MKLNKIPKRKIIVEIPAKFTLFCDPKNLRVYIKTMTILSKNEIHYRQIQTEKYNLEATYFWYYYEYYWCYKKQNNIRCF